MSEPAPAPKPFPAWLLLPLLALLALIPLFRQGASCGHDIAFHLDSWLDASRQLRHGTVFPAWDFNAAWNAGEPRFIFYPPLSWLLGELLTFVLPFAAVPAVYTALVLAAAGLSLYAAARRLVAPHAALFAATLYMANPYMLFTALERTAFAELLAAVWMPWLLLALLRAEPTIAGIAIPFALLWLTNAPAAVMGAYTIALLAALRLCFLLRRGASARSAAARFTVTAISGAGLGLALPAFYLLPAAYERRFVEISMALVPGLSFPANFLFAQTGDPAHDHVVHQATVLALTLLAVTAAALLSLFTRRRSLMRSPTRDLARPNAALLPAEPLITLAATTIAIAFLLQPLSSPLWKHLPELAFLQFPWRFLMVLATVAALALALLANTLTLPRRAAGIALLTAATILLAWPANRSFLQACPAAETPAASAQLFRSGHGVAPTDEYTPSAADNDVLRSDSPAFWLSPDPQAFAPNTTPNPNATAPDVDFGTPPPSRTLSHTPPGSFTITAPQPEYLVLNLRDFPNWNITDRSKSGMELWHPEHIQRDDGLLAIPISAGRHTIELHWRTGRDRILGAVVSLLAALVLLALSGFRSRKITPEHAV